MLSDDGHGSAPGSGTVPSTLEEQPAASAAEEQAAPSAAEREEPLGDANERAVPEVQIELPQAEASDAEAGAPEASTAEASRAARPRSSSDSIASRRPTSSDG